MAVHTHVHQSKPQGDNASHAQTEAKSKQKPWSADNIRRGKGDELVLAIGRV